MRDLSDLKDELEKCVRCGTCRSVCPVFRVAGREPSAARGKLTLIESYMKGEIGLTETYLKHLKECTLCGACRQNCPNSVNTVEIFNAARIDAATKNGIPLAASLIFKNLLDDRILPWALKMATRLQGLIFKDSSVEKGLLSRFSLPIIGSGRLLPPLANKFFMELPEVKALSKQEQGSKGPKIAFYAGCGINYLMPEVGTATLEVLKKAGTRVIVPEGQVCCGMPAFSMGDEKIARNMALKNLEAFEAHEFDFITTSCATCGHGLKNLFRKLLGDNSELKDRVEAFCSKVRDITELLVNELDYLNKAGNEKKGELIATYHDPCHLGRAQGLRDAPRYLIEKCSAVNLKEMKNPCSCCGLGGGLSTTNYDLSINITKRKVDNIKGSGADIVVTACPGCMVQLRDGLHKFGVKAKVAHVVELL
ncbi:MAG: (Fe-S)-binding protein [Deltaproteobacteria bacterium]|nr:(Fe-S)-binding protein [Deltaproteobacteria bacterium]